MAWWKRPTPAPEPLPAIIPAAIEAAPADLQTSIPVDVAFSAQPVPAVGATETLYLDGMPVQVPLSGVDKALAKGLTRAPVDVQGAIDAYRLKWAAAGQAGEAYIAETLAKGHIRREGDAVKFLAEVAHAQAAQAFLDLHNALQLTYPTLEEGAQS